MGRLRRLRLGSMRFSQLGRVAGKIVVDSLAFPDEQGAEASSRPYWLMRRELAQVTEMNPYETDAED